MPDGLGQLLEQARTITAIASSGIIDNSTINRLHASLLVLDAMLGDYYDPPYREARAAVVAEYSMVDNIADNGTYLNAAYAASLKWIKAIHDLMSRKGWMAPISTIIKEDEVSGTSAFVSDMMARRAGDE